MQVGFIGLGKMGSRMVTKLLKEGHEVVVWNRSQDAILNLKFKISNSKKEESLKTAESIENLITQLTVPRIVWLMLPAGVVTEEIIQKVASLLQKGDILIDGGNSYHKDTKKRAEELTKLGIRFLGIGVSGGIIASKTGYPLMVGGDVSAYQHIGTILDSLAKPSGGHEYLGKGGAGHFAKMVHNAIEYGYMQSIGEGFGVLENAEYEFDLLKVAQLYGKGTLISGFMMDRTTEALTNDPKLTHIAGVIGSASGETVWTVNEAKEKNLPIQIIESSLEFRKQSETDKTIQESFAAKLVAALREAFGGHTIKKT